MAVNKDILNNAETANPGYFNEALELEKRNTFSRREVGLTHPDTSSFIKLNDKGEIEIFAGEEIGIIISPATGTISLFADIIKLYTKEDSGVRWNNKSFNYAGDAYNEPSLVTTEIKEINSGFNYADYYLKAVDQFDQTDNYNNNIVTINGEFAFRADKNDTFGTGISTNSPSSISQNDLSLLKDYALTNSQDKLNYMKTLLESGFTFDQAAEKTVRDKGV
jgi:hypothetical protein